MQTILDDSHTWFLESCNQFPGGRLVIRLVEGIKGAERELVTLANATVGPYWPVTVKPTSRVVDITFDNALALFTHNESYDASDPDLQLEPGKAFLREVNASSYSRFCQATTTMFELFPHKPQEFLLWSEDQIFQVIASAPPTVQVSEDPPDMTVRRTQTWLAN
jgi:hypothetical protein